MKLRIYHSSFSLVDRGTLRDLRLAGHFWAIDGVSFYHPATCRFAFTEATYRYLLGMPSLSESLRQALHESRSFELDDSAIAALRSRIHFALESHLSDPVPESALAELMCMLLYVSDVAIEYTGRGEKNPSAELRKGQWPRSGEMIYSDTPGGSRQYCWRVHPLNFKPAAESLEERYPEFCRWISDPYARVVLSLGSGGARGSVLPLVFKLIDLLKLRPHIKEIWGCSIGAIYGYAYASGMPVTIMDRRLYDFFNERYQYFFLKRSLLATGLSIGKYRLLNLANAFRDEKHAIPSIHSVMRTWIEEVTSYQGERRSKIAFYAQATNLTRHGLFGLSESLLKHREFREFMVEADPVSALLASSAIPIIIGPTNLKSASGTKELWLDGGVIERTPLLLPFRKWRLERQLKQIPRHQKKLKILYVDLGPNLSMGRIEGALRKLPFVGEELVGAFKLISNLGDYRFQEHLQLLSNLEEVEVVGFNFNAQSAGALSINLIPKSISEARGQFARQLDAIEQLLLKNLERDDLTFYANSDSN